MSPQSLSRTYWRLSICARAWATASGLTAYVAIGSAEAAAGLGPVEKPVGEVVAPLPRRRAAVGLAVGLTGVLHPQGPVERALEHQPRRLADSSPVGVDDRVVARSSTVAGGVDDVALALDPELAQPGQQLVGVGVLVGRRPEVRDIRAEAAGEADAGLLEEPRTVVVRRP